MREIELVLGYLLMNYRITLEKEVDDILEHRVGLFATVSCEPSIGVKVARV